MKIFWTFTFTGIVLLLQANGQSLKSRFKPRPSATHYLSTTTTTESGGGGDALEVEEIPSSSRAPSSNRSLLRHQYVTSTTTDTSSSSPASDEVQPTQHKIRRPVTRKPGLKTTPIPAPVPPHAQPIEIKDIQGYLREVTGRSSTSNTKPTPTPTKKTTTTSTTTTATPLKTSDNDDDDSIRRGLIEKLCNRKYGTLNAEIEATTATVSTTRRSVSTTTLSTTSDRTNPLRRSRARVPRRVRKPNRSTTTDATTTSSTTTPLPSTTSTESSSTLCTDFDHLTFDKLMKRVKGGLRRKQKPQQN